MQSLCQYNSFSSRGDIHAGSKFLAGWSIFVTRRGPHLAVNTFQGSIFRWSQGWSKIFTGGTKSCSEICSRGYQKTSSMEKPILGGSFLPYRHAHTIYTLLCHNHSHWARQMVSIRESRKVQKISNNTGSQVATQMGVKWALNLIVHSKYTHHVVMGDVKDHAVLHLNISSLWAPHLPSHFFISNSCMQ